MPGLLATKLHRPSLPSRRVPRPQLIQRLNEGLELGRPVTLVSAPAGFGKTTCIVEWLLNLPSTIPNLQSCWLSLDAGDNDPRRFFAYLAAALQPVLPGLGDEIDGLLSAGPHPASQAVAALLAGALEGAPGRILLVLDDFHLIQERFILEVLGQLVANPPATLHWVLLTREDPSLPLARLRAHNQLTEIRANELRFRSEEAGRFLNEMLLLCLSPEDVAALEERTEGWIVGLQLAGLSLRDRPDPAHFIQTLSGSHRHILSYLTEEVLNRQGEEIKEFLLRTAVLERMCGELCDALIDENRPSWPAGQGEPTSQSILDYLERSNLFLIPLDDEGRWFRYHHLFADLLANRLRQTLPAGEIQELHRRASRWLAQNDAIDDAIQHALEGQDYGLAAALAEQTARAMMFTGRINQMKSWLSAIPEEFFEAHPRLSFYRTWIDLLQGKADLSEPSLQKMEAMLRALPPSPENDRLRMEMIVILGRFVALGGNTARAIQLSQEALAFLPENDLASRSRVFSALAIAYGIEGDAEKGIAAYDECLRLARASRNYSLAAHTMMLMGLWQCHYAQLHEAARTFQAIIDLQAGAGQKVFYPAGQGLIGLASVYIEWNELEKAQACLDQGLELCRQAGQDGLFIGTTFLSRLKQAQGDFEGALEVLRLLEQALPRSETFTVAQREIQTRLAMGDVAGASRWALPLLPMLNATGHSGGPWVPVVVLEMIQAVIARVFLAQGEIEKALHLLDDLEASAGPAGRFGRIIEVYLVRALAAQKQNQGRPSLTVLENLERALDLAEPENYIRIFVEEGEEIRLLIEDLRLRIEKNNPGRSVYFQKILAAFPVSIQTPPSSELEINNEKLKIVEPLTDRETEVLALIAEGLKYEEIAGRLYISVNTVRTYVKAIYGKLNVNNRSQAIAQAHQHKLI